MAKGTNQKFKLYRLAQILLEKTDDEHFITMPEILRELEKYEISAERKSIYTDIRDLEEFGIYVEGEQRGKLYYYHVTERPFELAELKLLVDSIQASKFITAKKSGELIHKIEKFGSEYEAKQLQRQVYVQDRIKSMNESIYYSVDGIHSAISSNRKIRFKYFNWNARKEMELRHDGEWYHVSPWMLSLDDSNYYLVAYDDKAGMIKHYRVDKMLNIEVTDDLREGREAFEQLDGRDYAGRNFGMFAGKEQGVTIRLHNSMCGVFIDRFGKDINFIPAGGEYCTVRIKVALSSHFYGWIFALGDKVTIQGPESVVREVRKEAARIAGQYGIGL